MELDGNEKKIQALYSELSFENQGVVPQFERLWMSATIAEVRRPGMPKALLILAAVIAVACSFAVWSWYRSTASPPQDIVQFVPQKVNVESIDQPTPVKIVAKPRRHRTIRRRSADRWTTTEAAMLSNWQSPTVQFMESPTSLTLNSLPKLNQSVKDLESFLPKNNDIMKESNR